MSSNPGQSYKGISRCILGQKACSSPINIINNFDHILWGHFEFLHQGDQ